MLLGFPKDGNSLIECTEEAPSKSPVLAVMNVWCSPEVVGKVYDESSLYFKVVKIPAPIFDIRAIVFVFLILLLVN